MKRRDREKRWAALLLAGAVSFSLCSCGGSGSSGGAGNASTEASLPPPEPAVSQEEPEEPQEFDSSQGAPEIWSGELSFDDLKIIEFTFSSGAGAWSTSLKMQGDGRFSGEYHDTDMGVTGEGYQATQYRCDFTGQFGNLEKVNDYTYAMELQQISYAQEPGTQEIIDEVRYCYSVPYGLDGGERFLIYLPGAPLAELPEEYVNWVALSVTGSNDLTAIHEMQELPFYGLYNEAQQDGFSGYDRVEGVRHLLALTQEQTDARLDSIQEERTLSQGEINDAYHQMYLQWDFLLNQVWSVLEQVLEPEEMEALTQEELEWIAWKEAQADQAGAEYGGGSLSIMAQTQKAVELTRDRVDTLMELLLEKTRSG